MKGIGMVVKYCRVTGKPVEESVFNLTLRLISPRIADKMSKEIEFSSDG